MRSEEKRIFRTEELPKITLEIAETKPRTTRHQVWAGSFWPPTVGEHAVRVVNCEEEEKR